MKRVVVIADTSWSIHRVHQDVAAALADDYVFTYFEARSFQMHEFMAAFRAADICMTTFNFYNDMIQLFSEARDRQKIAIVSHGSDASTHQMDCAEFTYGLTSATSYLFYSDCIRGSIYVVPNGVDPAAFVYRERDGHVSKLGWCGAPRVAQKRVEWAQSIASLAEMPLDIASTVPRADMQAWYDSIDLLLVTSGPNVTAETGPLPAFEAIVSGVPVIGTAVGNFSFLPGPKFTTIEEGVALIKELQANPDGVKALAKEQYECVMARWTYSRLAKDWRTMFEAICNKQQIGVVRPISENAYTGIDAYLYINLDHRTDRSEHIMHQLRSAEIPVSAIHRISASYRPHLGALGCTESHIKALEFAAENKKWQWIALFEDDFTFRNPLQFQSQIAAILRKAQPDVIMLAQGIEELDITPTQYPTIHKVNFAKTSSGYIIHRSYIHVLLRSLRESAVHLENSGRWVKAYTLDTYWKPLQHYDHWIAFQPSIGYQCESYSDVMGTVMNYKC